MEVQRKAQPEGWQADPYGRHELRFFDGTRWTPYVRDGEENGLDDPVGPIAEDAASTAARGGLLAEEVFVVERQVDLGRHTVDRVVRKADGTRLGLLRHTTSGSQKPVLRSLVAREAHKHEALEIVDALGGPVVSLLRPVSAPKSTVVVRDAEGRDAGRITQQNVRTGGTTYALLGPNSAFLGDLQADNWVSWDLWINDTRGRRVATITRDWDGLDRSRFPTTDDYIVRVTQPVPEPLRTLVVAAALSLDVALRPDARGV